ncbi:beta-galactosidase [Eubacterium ruminantium]|nr:beta-galactosidase [Eubacterium ruminantium]
MKVDHLLFGAAYYDEYMPYDRIEKDMEMMVKAGMNTIRIAESTWSTWEPEEGVFDFTHLDRMLDAAEKYNISVIVGTPTYAIPSWLAKKSEDILALTHSGQNTYGPRQNMDLTSPIYRKYAERMIRKLMEKVAGRKCVIGYQVDNETHHYDTCGTRAQTMFVEYLKNKFPDIKEFNHEFGLNYWSNRVDNWDNFPDIKATINASLGAEYQKFQRDIVTDFFNWQIDIISEYKSPEQFITHNFDFEWHNYSYGMHPEVDQRSSAKRMTVAGCDIYHPSQYDLTGHEITACGNIIRSLKNDNYLILETEAQGNQAWLPFPGQLRLQAYSHIGNGSNSVMYWHWSSIHNAIESYWKGVLSHDLAENETYREAGCIGNEWKAIGDHIKNLKKENKVAIVLDNNSLTGLSYFPTETNGKSSYNAVYRAFSDALTDLGIEFDVIPADTDALQRYDLVILPALYSAREEFLNAVNSYVEAGGNVIASFKTAFSDEYLKIYSDTQPHIINKCLGIHYDQFTYPKDTGLIFADSPVVGCPVNNQSNQPEETDSNIASATTAVQNIISSATSKCMQWMELVTCDTAESLARYDHKYWGKYSAVTLNRYGKGNAAYIATLPDSDTMITIISQIMDRLNIKEPSKLPFEKQPGLIVKQGINDFGRHVLFFLNYSDEEKTVKNISGNANALLTESFIPAGTSFNIEPWGVAILEYND